MSRLTFWEKTGCAGNARQKVLLAEADHQLDVRDLRGEPWSAARLLDFLGPLPVAEWFNRAAPRIKSGELIPETLTRDEALDLLLAEPLLIRRPLMERSDGSRMVGFDSVTVAAWIGLAANAPVLGEGCAAAAGAHCGVEAGAS